jgi:hypothetical protein
MNWKYELALLRRDMETGTALLRRDMELQSLRLERQITDGDNRLRNTINRAKTETIGWLVGIVLIAQVAAHFWH